MLLIGQLLLLLCYSCMTCNILVRLLFSFVVFSFACYGVVVFPMRVGLYCLVVYLWYYVFTVVRFVTYLFSPCLPLTALCLFCWFLALPGI